MAKLTPSSVYKLYVALRLHFTTPDYDFFKFRGKTKASSLSFEFRCDQAVFERLSDRYDKKKLFDLMVANLVANRLTWIGDLEHPDAVEVWEKWKRGIDSLSYVLKEESQRLRDTWLTGHKFDHLMRVVGDAHPTLLRAYYAGSISLETLIVYVDLFKLQPLWDKQITDTVLWPDTSLLINKYRPFLVYDKEAMKQIIRDSFLDML